MAVFTKISDADAKTILQNYELGEFESLTPITQGIDNTNYILKTTSAKFIITIFEKRLHRADVGFFVELNTHLIKHNFTCPEILGDKQGQKIFEFAGKPGAIVEFLEGAQIDEVTTNEITQLGQTLGKLHKATAKFGESRHNDLGLKGCKKLFSAVEDKLDDFTPGLRAELSEDFKMLDAYPPQKLPAGIIHADIFPDNVFFKNGQLTGIIDFYFSCYDHYILDLAIIVSAWCFKGNDIDAELFKTMLISYNSEREITTEEFQSLNTYLQFTALRFLMTRLYDYYNTPDDAIISVKNPQEYLDKLRFFKAFNMNL